MNSTPRTITALNAEPEADELHVWPSGQGVGRGAGAPGSCESPAEAKDASAHTNTRETSSLFMDSPCAEVVDGLGGYAARTPHHTAQTDDDLALYRTLADRKDFDSLTQLCRERLLTARDAATALRWTKDRAIVEALKGHFTGAYDLLAAAHYQAAGVQGLGRAKYENEFGIVLARLGRTSLAIERFGRAYQGYQSADNVKGCALSDHNRARALVTRGEHAKAMRYINRALSYARANNDYRLELEICESLIEFEGAR